jgi:hypothetical protein
VTIEKKRVFGSGLSAAIHNARLEVPGGWRVTEILWVMPFEWRVMSPNDRKNYTPNTEKDDWCIIMERELKG